MDIRADVTARACAVLAPVGTGLAVHRGAAGAAARELRQQVAAGIAPAARATAAGAVTAGGQLLDTLEVLEGDQRFVLAVADFLVRPAASPNDLAGVDGVRKRVLHATARPRPSGLRP